MLKKPSIVFLLITTFIAILIFVYYTSEKNSREEYLVQFLSDKYSYLPSSYDIESGGFDQFGFAYLVTFDDEKTITYYLYVQKTDGKMNFSYGGYDPVEKISKRDKQFNQTMLEQIDKDRK
ncbi:hypothetical protein EVJ27_06005 [Exiguobacterium sp. SH3S2]|uniref:hypothetical protein n=1 Tax=unclassified Exiguobacterium TaxID=2644629 RepID=UPI00103A4CA5|nr:MULTISPECIES: hypothetical protein [unclassified Exiguobacterium]TCI46452.1 hypothetical protein EVJ28_06000 [Exiguobacterium sp. SH3S3]TCI62094.1 hypothetical protein EVJ27_06005 [Exiguobacterium sp. SH3S2]